VTARRERSRARDVAGVTLGMGVLTGSALLARRARSRTEVGLFRSANALPDGAFLPIWSTMQYGTFGAVPVVAAAAVVSRNPRLAASIAVGGTAAWVTAKAAKRVVARGRPASIIDGVEQRGAEEGDLGFPSGHAAVSTTMTVVLWPEVSTGGDGRSRRSPPWSPSGGCTSAPTCRWTWSGDRRLASRSARRSTSFAGISPEPP